MCCYLLRGKLITNIFSIGNVWAMSRDETIYESPEIFNPDRFTDPSVPPVPIFGWGRRYELFVMLRTNSTKTCSV
jgi:hypothetical protein